MSEREVELKTRVLQKHKTLKPAMLDGAKADFLFWLVEKDLTQRSQPPPTSPSRHEQARNQSGTSFQSYSEREKQVYGKDRKKKPPR